MGLKIQAPRWSTSNIIACASKMSRVLKTEGCEYNRLRTEASAKQNIVKCYRNILLINDLLLNINILRFRAFDLDGFQLVLTLTQY